MLTLAEILEALSQTRPNTPDLVITDAVIDSRQAIPGSIFIALPGEKVDGHDYVSHAFEKGAHLALVQKDLSAQFPTLDLRGGFDPSQLAGLTPPFCLLVDDSLKAMQTAAAHWRRRLDIKTIGITGSVGKSTTKELVAEVLSRRYPTLKNAGNYNNEIGLPLTILRLAKGHQRAVLEMGFYVPGEIKFLCDIAQPEIGVVTNVGTVHAERAGSQEVISQGKGELIESLPAHGTAILNFDDPFVRQMADRSQAKVLFYGLSSEAHLWADQIEGLGLEGIRFRLHYKQETLHLRVPMLGRHSVHTALRAAAVGIADNMDWQEIIAGLRFGHMQLRLVAVRSESGALLLDDTYNASPQSTLAALNLLEELDGRKVAVLGDMLELGRYETEGHQMVGIRAAEIADRLIVIGERAKTIAQAAMQRGFAKSNINEVETSDQAIAILKSDLRDGDVVLVKGSRGMHMDNIVPSLETRQ
ncbi:MAG: UDP-N-acetylmuramoyl-tripeptide--D-alanyl-D-alanine ligase [Anaerolineae bacterium]|nr:UDP-N-acetylmuramoyl-tripeptide--D-alanyl-D-alanine ligase [Anaerolineae bacterium]